MPADRDTLLNLLRATPIPQPCPVTVLGVDDFACAADTYTTPCYWTWTLTGRSTCSPAVTPEPHAVWLRAYPGAEIACRDRPAHTPKAPVPARRTRSRSRTGVISGTQRG
jgi:hypothetical protein